MSEPGRPAPGVVAPALPTRAAPPARLGAVLGAFGLDLLLAFVLLLAAAIVLGLGWLLLSAAGSTPVQPGGAQAPAAAGADPMSILVTLLGMAATALGLYFLRQPASADERRWSRAALGQASTWAWIATVTAAVLLGNFLVGQVMSRLGVEPVPTNLALVDEAITRWPLLLVLVVVVLAPMYEELLFRRVLFGRFLRGGWPWLGLVLSSLAFALVHEVPGLSDNPPAAVLQLWLSYAGMGAAFAWLYWRTGTLWAPILAHGLNNGLALALHVSGAA